MKLLILVFIGGGLGAATRYSLSLLLYSEDNKFPWPILICNLIGCLAIGIIFGLIKNYQPSWISPLLITGFLGGFTTFSSFALDTQKLLANGMTIQAFAYISASLLGGLTLCYAGLNLTGATLK